MSAAAGPLPFRRDTGRGLVAGVLAGLGERVGIDPVILRVAFVVVAVASGGIALLAYLVAWAALPAADGRPAPLGRLARGSRLRGDWRVAIGVSLLTLSALLAFRELGIWWSDALVWPLVLAAFGVVLLWGRTRGAARASESRVPAGSQPAAAATGESPGVTGASAKQPSSSLAELYRGTFGVLLVLGAGLLFLSANHVLGGLRDAALTAVVVVVALGLILAPFLWRLARNLALERAERIRSQERAEFAAHLHDSVLQTLTLMQKRADDPREVAALARRQERELRSWLGGGEPARPGERLADALRAAAEEVEEAHGTPIDAVVVGDAPLDERTDALVSAAREALTNAAKFAAAGGPVRLYAEIDHGDARVFIDDRGPGFDPDAIPNDRRGVRESIIGRMNRHGGRAEIRSEPGDGTEVELSIRAGGR